MNKLIVAAACSLMAGTASAAPVYFYGIDPTAGQGDPHPVSSTTATAFATAAGTLSGPITFEALPQGYASSIALGGGVTATFAGDVNSGLSGVADIGVSGNASGFNTTTPGSQFLRLSSIFATGTDVTTSVTFSFAVPITAFGAYVTGLGTAAGAITVGFNDGAGQTYALVGSSTPGTLFFGITDTSAFSSISFTEVIPGASLNRDNFGFDDIVYSAGRISGPVPEPASWAMLVVGFGTLGAALRRRRSLAASIAGAA